MPRTTSSTAKPRARKAAPKLEVATVDAPEAEAVEAAEVEPDPGTEEAFAASQEVTELPDEPISETRVGDPANVLSTEQAIVHRQPTVAEAEAIQQHVEVRVAELVACLKAEAAKHGADPVGMADYILARVREGLQVA